MRKIRYHRLFKKDYKRIQKRGYNLKLLEDVLSLLVKGELLPQEYHDHPLIGNYAGVRECHIKPDWLLIYKMDDNGLTVIAMRTGSHSDLF